MNGSKNQWKMTYGVGGAGGLNGDAGDVPVALIKELLELRGAQGPVEEIALEFVAVISLEEIFLFDRFDAFGDHLQLQAVGEHDDRVGDRGVVRVAAQVAHERL